jgi:THO complex subunit 1
VEISSSRECQRIFDFVERHLEIWNEPLFLNSGKNAVLRMCNDLLQKLSRAQNTIFCGRILIILSNYFPFSERSSLNIMSEFIQDNVTVYKSDDGTDDPDDKMDVTLSQRKNRRYCSKGWMLTSPDWTRS